jgi:PST family polysaccharide transporter/lipopolysaccharide exporter
MIPKLPAVFPFVRNLLTPGPTLADRAVTGGLWMGLLNASDRLVRLVTLLLLASFLTPAAFGLHGLAVLTLAIVRGSSKLGLDAALVQEESDDVDEYLDTVWVLKAVRGIALVAIAFVVAPSVASFFDAPRLTDVVRVIAVVPLVTGLRNPGVVYFHKDLDFHRQFVYEISGSLAYAGVAVAVALVSPTVWALVGGLIARALVRTVVSFGIHPYRPRVGFDPEAARGMLGYGKWIFGSGLVVLALNWIDDGLVGWYFGAASLGLYRLAFQVSMPPVTEVTGIVSTVVFPAYSRLQDDTDALRDAFVRTVRLTSYLSFPMAVGIAVVSPLFVRTFFSPEWEPMIPVIRVLVIWAALRSIVASIGPLFRAIGRPEYNTALQSFRLVVLAVVLFPAAATWGLAGAALALVISGLVENPVAVYLAARRVDAEIGRIVGSLAVPAFASLSMGAIVLSIDGLATGLPSPVTFVVLVVVGIVAYPSLLFLMSRYGNIAIEEDLATIRRAME